MCAGAGPGRVPCAPYESLWRNDVSRFEQGSLMGAPADAVGRIYRGLGVQLRSDAHELPDHIQVEWEALACALDRDAIEHAHALLRDHLAVWMAPFCAAVAGETQAPFYAALAGLTPAWTAALSG
jgi:TorA maturation chaperone TorD